VKGIKLQLKNEINFHREMIIYLKSRVNPKIGSNINLEILKNQQISIIKILKNKKI
jgi:hypothetical protein